MIVSPKFELVMLIAPAPRPAGEHCRAETFAAALRFSASLTCVHDFAGLHIDDPVIEHHHRLGIGLVAARCGAHSADRCSRASAYSAIVTPKHDDIALQRQIRAANLSHARARTLLHAIAGIEILFLRQAPIFRRSMMVNFPSC